MSFLDRLLHRSSATDTELASEQSCIHVALIPRWESAADMGRPELATGYRCDSCGTMFTPDEVHALRVEAFARLRDPSEPRSTN